MSFLDMVNGPPKLIENYRLYATKETSPYPDLLTETLNFIENEEDVLYVIFCEDDTLKSASWNDFKNLAKDIYYDSGYGSQEISSRLTIVGKSWWLERHEYDGSEWWEFKTMPKKPESGILKLENII